MSILTESLKLAIGMGIILSAYIFVLLAAIPFLILQLV